MRQDRRFNRLRKILRLETLEDRTLLSGVVTAVEDPLTGVLSITGDKGNNAITLTQPSPGVLRVAGVINIPPFPGRPDVTSVNHVAYHDFVLGSITSINVQMLNGTDKVAMTGFNVPGNITINSGTGVDTFSLNSIQTSGGIITITASGASADTISLNSVVAGAAIISAGAGADTISLNSVQIGTVNITTGAGTANDTIIVSNSLGTPSRCGIGLLTIVTGDGNNTISVTNTTLVNLSITAGIGNNTLTLDQLTVQSANITLGTENVGAKGSNAITISNVTVTGPDFTLNVLNESGVSGVLIGGGPGTGPGAVNTLAMNNVQFTGKGDLNVRIDDGVTYFNQNGKNELDAASVVVMTLVDTGGNVNVTLGDHFELVQLGNGTIGLNDIDANNLSLSVGNDLDAVIVSAIVQQSEGLLIGDVSIYPIPPLPPPSVLINGIVGDNDGDSNDNLTINIGNNNNANLGSGWPITVSETVTEGNLVFTGGNGLAVSIGATTVSDLLSVALGNGGPGDTESLTLTGVTAGDLVGSIDSKASDAPDGNATAGVNINLSNVQVTDPYGGMTLTDSGEGADFLTMVNVNVVESMSVVLSAGINTIVAQNVTTGFGSIDGGSGPSNVYVDQGGNFGYFVFDVAARIAAPSLLVLNASDLSLSATAINQGDLVTLTGSFSQPGNSNGHTVTINWGDGTAITQLPLAPGVFTFSATHQYFDDGAPAKVDTITVTVADSSGNTATASTSITVNDVPPTIPRGDLRLSASTINEGGSVVLAGDFVDPGLGSTHRVVIDWGDGSTATTFNLNAGVLLFGPVSHTYQDNKPGNAPYLIQVTVSDEDNTSTTASTQVTVLNVPPANIALGFTNGTLNEGGTATLNGSFTDPGVLDTHTVVINWGDGSPNTTLNLAANVLTFSANHQYLNNAPGNAPYTVQTTVSDEDNASGTASAPVTVDNMPPANLVVGFTNATINAGDTATLNGSFTDPGVLDTHTVVINWGDGSPNTTLNLAANVLTFSANHQYQNGAAYTVQTTVSDQDNASSSASTQITVNGGSSGNSSNVPPANLDVDFAAAPISAGDTATLNGSFTDPNVLDTHTVVINWGDGSSNTTLNLAANVLTFTASHPYQNSGLYTIQVTVTDPSNASVSDSEALLVTTRGSGNPNPGAPSLTLSGAANVGEGSPYFIDLTSQETGGNTITSWTIAWGDGTIQTLNGNPSSATHVYAEGLNTYTIVAKASDQGGTYNAADTVTVQVIDVPPTLALSGPTTANPLSPYTLNLSASDPGTDPITSWTINWGDGTTQTVGGDSNSVTHSYALIHRAYTISAQATSTDGTFSAGNTLSVDMAFATANENYIAQVYLDLLNRPVDLSGLESWTGHLQNGESRDQVMLLIMQSVEYRTLRVEQLYESYLGRAADPQGLRDDLLALATGTTIDQVKAGILGSDEYFATRASGTPTGFVSALYYDVLGRSGKPGEIEAWVLGEQADFSRSALASVFIGTAEADKFLVQNFYQKFLHRDGDSAGLDGFIQARQNDVAEETIIAAFLGSDEYYKQAIA